MKSLKIEIPDGYEIDKDKSTFEEIKFKKCEPKKAFILRTEDGIDLCEGDRYYTVFTREYATNQIEAYKVLGYYTTKLLKENRTYSTNCKYFSSKAKAEDWVYYNKPTNLSLNEILSVWGANSHSGKTSLLFRRIESLAIQKK